METAAQITPAEIYEIEDREWIESLDFVFNSEGPERIRELLDKLQIRAQQHGVIFSCPGNTPYLNTISRDQQPPYPGSLETERRIRNIIRWNAMAMVVNANRELSGIGGHISTFASLATLLEVALNHFIRGKDAEQGGDIVYLQGHAAPGVYARAFLEGRLTERDLYNFRRELRPEGGIPSYPHPWLMPGFWEFPTVSMGLSPIMAIYQARFNRYLADRGVKDTSRQRVWAFLGDGEMDEPESMGAITLAAREQLDNLLFVINCNLQRLDGPVRGNGQIIQELEAAFRGARWNVIKVIWSGDWDTLFEKDDQGILVERLNRLRDGQAQTYAASDGAYFRRDFFGQDQRLLHLVESYSDEQLHRLRRGGHDPEKLYAAYKAAMECKSAPTVILAQTIKGYGLGESGEGRNVTHQQKKLNEKELREFRSRMGIPISDEEVAKAPFYRPADDSEEVRYVRRRRDALGGPWPRRVVKAKPIEMPGPDLWNEFLEGTGARKVATTMAFVRLLSKLLQDEKIGRMIVPIVPDESRTFGMEALFRQFGIYSHCGQLYEPVDRENLLYYNETKNGAILEEGITEAGAMSSFIAAGTAHATHGINMIPFFIFYSMFGFQRVGDLIWAAGDAHARGFLIGGTSGRTTLAGEGLQHQDGNSHLLAYPVPNVRSYDPTFAYELAVIIRDGLRRMYVRNDPVFYYITVMNEFYPMPAMPQNAEPGILKGLYLFRPAPLEQSWPRLHILGSGSILLEALKAQRILQERFEIAADVWSVTSYKQLYLDAIETERWNILHPAEEQRRPYVSTCFAEHPGTVVAATDYVKALPCSISQWVPGGIVALGTDGYGRSDGRDALRNFFGVDAKHIVLAALHGLAQKGEIAPETAGRAVVELGVDANAASPLFS